MTKTGDINPLPPVFPTRPGDGPGPRRQAPTPPRKPEKRKPEDHSPDDDDRPKVDDYA
ncbi:MAG: hypothetical protein ACYC18_04210 [Gammaproteobacteria bacterium]|nr:hypothetical protein [Gammaproteobacteria bacterium]